MRVTRKEYTTDVLNRIKELRIQYGYSQSKLAKEIFISLTEYRKIEAGEKPMKMRMLISILRVFRIKTGYFFRPITQKRYGKSTP